MDFTAKSNFGRWPGEQIKEGHEEISTSDRGWNVLVLQFYKTSGKESLRCYPLPTPTAAIYHLPATAPNSYRF